MTEQVQLELIRSVPLIVTAVFSFAATVITLWVGQKVKDVHKQLNGLLHEDRAIALKVSDEKAVAAHAAGVKEEQDNPH